jgi:hypothetical protein
MPKKLFEFHIATGSHAAREIRIATLERCMDMLTEGQMAAMDCGDRPDRRLTAIFFLESVRRGMTTRFWRECEKRDNEANNSAD